MSTVRPVILEATHSELKKRQIRSDEVFSKLFDGLEACHTEWEDEYIAGNKAPLALKTEALLKEIGLSEEERRVRFDDAALETFFLCAAIEVRDGMEELEIFSDAILISLVQTLMYRVDDWVGVPYTSRELVEWALTLED